MGDGQIYRPQPVHVRNQCPMISFRALFEEDLVIDLKA